MDEKDWTDDPSVEAVSNFIWIKFNALSEHVFYSNDTSEDAEQFKQHCLDFIEEAENELSRFKELVEQIKMPKKLVTPKELDSIGQKILFGEKNPQ